MHLSGSGMAAGGGLISAVIFIALCLGACSSSESIRYTDSAAAMAGARLKLAVNTLFDSYEGELPAKFMRFAGNDLALNDNSGRAYRAAQLEQALADDFRNLSEIRFDGIVESVVSSQQGKFAMVQVNWTRRARAGFTNEEWLVTSQHSKLIVQDLGDRWVLSSIEGDPVFGVSDRTGRIMLDRGNVNGALATGVIEHGRLTP